LLSFSFLTSTAQTWTEDEILLNEDISDGLIEDINKDGKKDLLLIAGNYINIFFQKDRGFSSVPDSRIFYGLLGEYIDVGEVDPSSPGLELLGLSEKGIKCFYNDGSHFVERPGYLISSKVDMPEYRLGPLVSDFASDINSDGRDEIFFLKDNKIQVGYSNDSGQFISLPVNNTEELRSCSMQSMTQGKIGFPAKGVNRPFYLYQPSVRSEKFILFQDFNSDGRLEPASMRLPHEELERRYVSMEPSLIDSRILTDQGRLKFYLDINSDGFLDLIFLEVIDIFTQNINVFPFVKVSVHLNKSGRFAQTPDFFQKTILVSDQPPFVDVDGDGDLDFISVWSQITPGSKEDIVQVLLESTWNFTLRCYLFDKDKAYSTTPHIYLQTKIKQDISQLSVEIPFDLSGDFDGNGTHDLIIKKDPESLYIYFFDLSAKNYIIKVKRLNTPAKLKGHRIVDLDGDGRSDIIFFTAKGVRINFTNAE
jgi:hypothetical protein